MLTHLAKSIYTSTNTRIESNCSDLDEFQSRDIKPFYVGIVSILSSLCPLAPLLLEIAMPQRV